MNKKERLDSYRLLLPIKWQTHAKERDFYEEGDELDLNNSELMKSIHEGSRNRQIKKLQDLFGTDFDESCFCIKGVFPVFHQGWEGDELGFMVEYDGRRYVLLTAYDRPYIAENKELVELTIKYHEALNSTKLAMDWVLK